VLVEDDIVHEVTDFRIGERFVVDNELAVLDRLDVEDRERRTEFLSCGEPGCTVTQARWPPTAGTEARVVVVNLRCSRRCARATSATSGSWDCASQQPLQFLAGRKLELGLEAIIADNARQIECWRGRVSV